MSGSYTTASFVVGGRPRVGRISGLGTVTVTFE